MNSKTAVLADMEKPFIEGGSAPVRDGDDFLVFGQPWVGEEEIAAVTEVLRSRWIGTGPVTRAFEAEFADYTGAAKAVAVNSATAALHLSLLALNVGPGDEVITTSMTFCSTVNVILHVGAKPVLADCDPYTQNILPEEIEKRITPRTKAIIPVHLAGRMCDMDRIMEIADAAGIPVIEDCAHAIETTLDGKHAGTYGALGCFSFYATKNLTTGEGGMVIGNDEELVENVRALSLHGLTRNAWSRFSASGFRHYDVERPGFKYNLTDIASALGRVQLASLEERLPRRREIFERYNEAFSDLPLQLPLPGKQNERLAYHLYQVLVQPEHLTVDRDRILSAIQAENIGVGVHYTAVHTLAYGREILGYAAEDLPNAANIGARTLSLPLSGTMSDRDVDDTIKAVRKVINWYKA